MRTSFRLSKSRTDDSYIHLICLNPVAVFLLPNCTCISGDANPDLQKKAFAWYLKNVGNQVYVKRIIPPGYEEAIQIVRDNIEQIDILKLASDVGIRERDLARVLDGVKYKDIPFHLSYRLRVRFKDEVQKLLL